MSKKLLSVAIAAAIAAPMAAQAEIKLSGAIQAEIGNLDIPSLNNDAITTTTDSTGALAGGGPNRVRLDFSEDLGGSLKAFGRIDWGFNTTTGPSDLSDREAFVGLKSGSGAYFRMGRIEGAYKTTPKIDPFYSTVGQMRIGGGESSGAFGHGGFVDNVAELGFSGGGFGVALQGIFTDDNNGDLVDDGATSRSGSMLANASYSNDMFTVYGAYSKNEAAPNNANTNYKLGAKVSFGGLGVGLQYEDVEMNGATLFSLRPDAGQGEYIAGSLTYGLGSVTLAGWVAQFTADNNAADAMSFAAGAVYSFSKKTMAYAAYHSIDSDDLAGAPSNVGDISGFAAGVRHSF